jgi:DUF971 family protein
MNVHMLDSTIPTKLPYSKRQWKQLSWMMEHVTAYQTDACCSLRCTLPAAAWQKGNGIPSVQVSNCRIQNPYWFDSDLHLPGMMIWNFLLEEAEEAHYKWIANLRYLQSLRSLKEVEVEGFRCDTLHSH